MPQIAKDLKVPKQQGQKAVVLLDQMKLLDRRLLMRRDDDSLCIPVVDQLTAQDVKILKDSGLDFVLEERQFESKPRQKRTLAEELEEEVPPHLLAVLPRSLDLVGDIAIVEIPPELEPQREVIGKAVLRLHRNVRTVLAKAGAISGKFRTRELNFVAGEKRTETTHTEHGCRYRVDVAKAFFSPRLSQEHKRVSSLVQEGETVADLFSGVGPFDILIAKDHERVDIYAVDANPDAVEYLKINIRLNRVMEKVHPILGDAREVVDERIFGVADRVIMNLPETGIEYVETACHALKIEGGIIHFYSFADSEDTAENIAVRFSAKVEDSGRKVKSILGHRVVRETAPHKTQVVVDAAVA